MEIKEVISKIKEKVSAVINKIGKEGILHFLLNFIIVLVVGLLTAPVLGVASGICLSILWETAKEYKEEGTGWKLKDLLINFVGIVTAYILL